MAANTESNPNKIARQERRDEKKKARLAKAVAREDEKLNISVGETPNAQETKTNESTPNKSFTKYIDATGNQQTEKVVSNTPEEEIVVGEQTETTTPSYNPGQALTSIMSMAPITGGNVFANVIRANPNMSFNEMKDVAEKTAMVDDAKEEVTQEKQAVVNALGNEMVQQQNVQGQTPPTAGGMGGATTDVSGTTTTGGAPSAGPATSNIGEVVTSKEPTRPSYQETVTQEQLARDLAQASSELDFITPDAVMEKLQLTDYYPNAGRDIAVGNWTGSVLGSQTIYSGAGGLLPMGLYDARKRAIANAAKQKQAIIDKFLELPDTADQFQKNYKEYGFNTLINDGLKQYGSYEKMIKSPEWRQKYARFKNTGIELMYYDKQADKVIKDLSDGTRYVPKQMRELAYKVKQGLTDDIENILSGKSNFLKEAGGFRSYENGTAHVDALVKNGIFNKDRLSEMPINLKTAEAEANPKEYSDFVRSLNEGSRDNDTFVTQFKRFYDVSNAEKLIDSLYRDNNFDPSTKQSTLDYFLAQIPNQVVNEYNTSANKSFQREELALRKIWKDREYELRKDELLGHYDVEHKIMHTPGADGKTYADKVREIQQNKNLTPSQRALELKKAATQWGGRQSEFDPYTGTVVFKQDVPTYMKGKGQDYNPKQLEYAVKQPRTRLVNGKYVPIRNKKGQIMYDDVYLSAEEIANKRKDFLLDMNGKPITEQRLTGIRQSLKDGVVTLYPQEHRTMLSSVDKYGNAKIVDVHNLGKVDLKNTGYVISTNGKAFGMTRTEMKDGVEIEVPGAELLPGARVMSSLENPVDRSIMNRNIGPKPQFTGAPYGVEGETEVYGSGSSSMGAE